jgi:preprotein translocase subunit SecG
MLLSAQSGSKDNRREVTKMEVLKTIVLVLEALASVALIGIVLLQSGKEAGLSGAIAGNSDSYMSKSKNGGLDKKLASATKWVALVWIVLTLAISLLP